MRKIVLTAMAALLVVPAQAQDAAPVLSPGEIAAAAPADDWIAIAASDLLVMDLAPDARGSARRVVIQLMPAPFSQGWIGNIRKLVGAHWWDGTSVNRVQDNYVAQWGDATEKKALPPGLAAVPEREYVVSGSARAQPAASDKAVIRLPKDGAVPATGKGGGLAGASMSDAYAPNVAFESGWPIGSSAGRASRWPLHCYAAVGVGRNMSPDTGSGAELYAVIGHAPRHLDRNIAVVGRIISGIEHLSSLPRGTKALGFYKDAAERVTIRSIRIASDLSMPEQPKFEYLSTESDSFARYVDARRNRRDPFFIVPAGGADICNIPVPVRPVGAK
ncbi:MAG: peptidylprolyl isomerase [Sphingopyxis sp.]|nr:peptidylprolyl isomerase [Sphingopyxis sp.]